MRKIIFIFAFSAVMIFNLSAKEHDFSIGVDFGLLNGHAQELVYKSYNSDGKLSELLWNFKSLSYIGLDVRYSWLKSGNRWGVFFNGSYKRGFSSENDVMEDRDWLAADYPDCLTNYSVHKNNTEFANLADLNLGILFLISKEFFLQNINIKTYLSYHFMNFSWTARGGSLLYPASIGGHMYISPILKVGTYEQTWHIFSPAISFYGEFNRYFDIELAFEITPFISFLSKDEHLLRNLVIIDNLNGGLFIEPSLLFSFKPSDLIVLSLSFAYREISKSRGNSLYKQTLPSKQTSSSLEKNIGGAGYTATDIGIIAKFKI
jgi:outer membrane protease